MMAATASRPRRAWRALWFACLVFGGAAHAADSSEIWPEISAYIAMSPNTRLHLDASYARGTASDARSLDLSATIDISIKPILREQYWGDDWQRSRYFWARIGYTRVFNVADSASYVAEDRGVVALYGRTPLPAEVWLEARARADLRWISDDYSARYRFRLEASREFTLSELAAMAYFSAEAFYDTRYESWSRTVYQAGTEVAVSRTFRYELYLARQIDRQPSGATINALGLVAKWYF